MDIVFTWRLVSWAIDALQREKKVGEKQNKKMSKLEEIIKVLGSFTALKHARRM